MTKKDKPAGIGHNKPPRKTAMDKLDEQIGVIRDEVEHWLDGTKVENEGQMNAVDDLVAAVKEIARQMEVEKEKKYRPIKEKLDAVAAFFNPKLKELETWRKGLLKINSDFKVAEKRRREAEAAQKKREAEEALRAARMDAEQADYANLEERRKADEALLEARQQHRQVAAEVKGAHIGGVRKRAKPKISDYKAVINHIRVADPDALVVFCDHWVSAQFHKGNRNLPGVEIVEVEEAF